MIRLPSAKHALAFVLSAIALLGISVAILVNGLTQTERGHELVRRVVLHVLRGPIHGRVQIGRIDGNLLHTLILLNVSIADSAGAPFFAADRVEAHYDLRDFAHQWVFLSRITMDRPTVVLSKTPAGTMNVARIFPPSATPTPPGPSTGWGSALAFSDLRIRDGTVVVDTTIAVHNLDAIIPGVVLAAPAPFPQPKAIDIASLQGSVALASLHPASVRDLVAAVFFTDDSLWWSSATLLLPESHITTSGRFGFTDTTTDVTAHAAPITLADAKFIDSHIPADGRLSGDIAVSMHGPTQLYSVAQPRPDGGTAARTHQWPRGHATGDSTQADRYRPRSRAHRHAPGP